MSSKYRFKVLGKKIVSTKLLKSGQKENCLGKGQFCRTQPEKREIDSHEGDHAGD